jgi:hypothetical protein
MNHTPQVSLLRLILMLGIFAVALPALHVLNPEASSTQTFAGNRPARRVRQNEIRLRRGLFDTSAARSYDTSQSDRERALVPNSKNDTQRELRLVQFRGPVQLDWYRALAATSADIIEYVPDNAYLIFGDVYELALVARLDAGEGADDLRPIRWMGRLDAVQKLDPRLGQVHAEDSTDVEVEIELVQSPQSRESWLRILELSHSTGSDFDSRLFGKYLVVRTKIARSRLLQVSEMNDVMFVGPAPRIAPLDEVADQIVAGDLSVSDQHPIGPGYKSWLEMKGLSFTPDFLIDVADTGLDRGSTLPGLVHPDFLNSAGDSRVAYIINYPTDASDDRLGHGSLVASIVAGLGSPDRTDPNGFMYGLGVDPFINFGASRIFDRFGMLANRLSFTAVASSAYERGARIENNSWGSNNTEYDSAAQEYDMLARDADPAVEGNQEMTFVFAAGNNGPGRINSPAGAKNVIAVGASENFRPEGFDSCDLDRQGGIGPDGANNIQDVLRYSSGGPTLDGRRKPDIVAPGTHIYGAASRSLFFFGQGLCAGTGVYQPPGQSFYTWSSGTSLATPHITGCCSLIRKFFVAHDLLGNEKPPSPAMTKAFLLNSASYLDGENSGGDLPSLRAGWGLANLSRAFDDTRRFLLDQTHVFTETGQTFEVSGSLADRTRPLRATLTWTDAPGSLLGPALVNDLDLELKIGDSTIYRGNNFVGDVSIETGEPDSLNNVESIYIPASLIPEGSKGNFTIIVRAANIAGDGVPGNDAPLDQDFALVVYNLASPLDPPPPGPVPPTISAATYVKKVLTITGRDFSAAAQVEINGSIINRPFEFTAGPTLSIKLKRRKLKLNEGADNQLVLIEDGERSQPFVLRL